MPSTIHHPQAFLKWQSGVVRARAAHLYRVIHDGRGNWTVTRPGSDERRYFPADDGTQPQPYRETGGDDTSKSASALSRPTMKTLTPAEKHAAEVRSSYVNLSA